MTNAEAIETLRANYPDACFEQLRAAVDKAIKALEAQEWIPCSERLPEAEGCYITTARWKDNEPFYVCENEYGFKINERWNGSDRIFDNGAAFGDMWGDEIDNLMEVIAWMPLPVPYREDES